MATEQSSLPAPTRGGGHSGLRPDWAYLHLNLGIGATASYCTGQQILFQFVEVLDWTIKNTIFKHWFNFVFTSSRFEALWMLWSRFGSHTPFVCVVQHTWVQNAEWENIKIRVHKESMS